jgi:fucose permease
MPWVITSVSASLLGTGLTDRFGSKRMYLLGLSADLVSMLLLIASRLVMTDRTVAFPILLASTACLGVGFGLTVPALNTLTAAFSPDAVDRSVLVLNALLGLGTALAPVFVAIFVGLGFWEGLALLVALLLLVLLIVSLRLPLEAATSPQGAQPQAQGRTERRTSRRTRIPAPFWVFAVFTVLYGFCETMNGNWSQLVLTEHLGLGVTVASLALTAFWAVVTAGRVLFAAIQRWFPSRLTYHILPFVLAAAFLLIAALPRDTPVLSILAFALAGLGCSALFPLTISFGQERFPALSDTVAGGVIACYPIGFGVAAYGVGPLRDHGVAFPAIFTASAGVAVALGALSFVVAYRRPSPVSLHPRPEPPGAVASN